MADSDILQLTVLQLSQLIRRRLLSVKDLVQLCVHRIEALNTRLNAFVAFDAQKALKTAEQHDAVLSQGYWRGPLHGIPIAIKDNIWTSDFPTTACSSFMKNYHPPMDAAVVSRLRAAGAIILGKTNMHEWAYGATNESSFFGAARNPWDDKRISGGSSGGSAVAVATGMVPAALGSDTGGSVRIPAAACGISSMKPTYGTVSNYGVFPLSWSFDVVGPLARSLDDVSVLLSVLSGSDDAGALASSDFPAIQTSDSLHLKGLRLAVPLGDFFKQDPVVEKLFQAAVQKLMDEGAVVEEVNIAGMDEAYAAWKIIQSAEASTYHADFMQKNLAKYSSSVRVQLEAGRCISALEYLKARQYQTLFNRELNQMFSGFDAFVLATLPVTAPLLGAKKVVLADHEISYQEAMIRFTWIANLGGLPALTVPCGFAAGLPVGLMFMGQKNADSKIIAIARRYQVLTSWHKSSCVSV